MKLRNMKPGLCAFPLVVFLLTVVSFGETLVEAATLKVPGSYATIQGAIDAASAGDTIKISKGRYTENIVVNKSLTIRGKKYKTRIQAANAGSPVVTIAADNVVLKQFDTRGGSFGVTASNVVSVKLQSLRVQNAQADGVFLRNVSNASLIKCRVYDNAGNGVLLEANDPGAGNAIQKCRVYKNSGNGISLEQSPGTLVESNRVYDNGPTGISGGDAVESLRIRKNRVWGHARYGIMFGYESGGHVAESNVCTKNGVGIFLAGSAGVARRNTCDKNEIGFSLGTSAWTVEGNKARKNTSHGFVVDDFEGSENTLKKNESTDNQGSGFRILSGQSEGLYKDNLAKGNAEHGFHITPFGGLNGSTFDGNRSLDNGGDGFNLTENEVGHSVPPTTIFTDNFADNNDGFGFVSVDDENVTYDGNTCGGNNAAGPSNPVGICD